MKKVLAIALCVCIALTISVATLAESPQNTVIIRKGVGSKQDGTSVAQDTFTAVSENDTITITANEKTYGKFNKWTIYVVSEDENGETTYTEAKEGVDYIIVSGSLEDRTAVIKPLNKLAIAGNYNGETTDPAELSTETSDADEDDYSTNPKTGDIEVLYVVFAMLAAAAVVFGAKKQLSK